MRPMLLLVCALLLGGAEAAGADSYAWPVLRVIDGDTVVVRLPDLPDMLAVRSVRLANADTPEMGWRARCDVERTLALRARDFTEAAMHSGRVSFAPTTWAKRWSLRGWRCPAPGGATGAWRQPMDGAEGRR